MDAIENAFFITYALLALNGVSSDKPALPLIYIFANFKWMRAFTALYAFGLVWTRNSWLGWLISCLILLFSLIGVLGIAFPGLISLRGLFFLLGMLSFAGYFWQQTHK